LHILTFSAHESGAHMVRGPFCPPRLRPRVALSAKTIVLPVMYG
jgi:hypothetical protein